MTPAKFQPFEFEEGKQEPIEEGAVEQPADKPSSEVQKVRESIELQKLKVEEIKLEQEAALARNNIVDIKAFEKKQAELADKGKVAAEREKKITERENRLTEIESDKAIEISEMQKIKAELDKRATELDKRETQLKEYADSLQKLREILEQRQNQLHSVERQKLADEEKYHSLVETLKRELPRVLALMGDNATLLTRSGFRRLGDGLWEEVDRMDNWSRNSLEKHADIIVEWLKAEVEDCNRKAIYMSHRPRDYSNATWNLIVDNLEEMWERLPILRPHGMPRDEEER